MTLKFILAGLVFFSVSFFRVPKLQHLEELMNLQLEISSWGDSLVSKGPAFNPGDLDLSLSYL